MNLRKVTQVLIILTVVVLVVYDIYAIYMTGGDASISFEVIRWSKDYPAVPFMLGALMGHLFWPAYPYEVE